MICRLIYLTSLVRLSVFIFTKFTNHLGKNNHASVAELAYALGLEPSVARHKGSTPFARTVFIQSASATFLYLLRIFSQQTNLVSTKIL